MAEAMKRDSGLLREAAAGRSGPMIEAIRQEARVRADPNLRADRFVERWQQLSQDRDRLYRAGDMAGRKTLGQGMAGMAKALSAIPRGNRTRPGAPPGWGLGSERSRAAGLGGRCGQWKSVGR